MILYIKPGDLYLLTKTASEAVKRMQPSVKIPVDHVLVQQLGAICAQHPDTLHRTMIQDIVDKAMGIKP